MALSYAATATRGRRALYEQGRVKLNGGTAVVASNSISPGMIVPPHPV